MRKIYIGIGVYVILACGTVQAEQTRQECIGRLTFEVPEDMEWATYDAGRAYKISDGGGHNFTAHVTAKGDNSLYGDDDDLVIYVSDVVDRESFDSAARYVIGKVASGRKRLIKELALKESLLEELKLQPDAAGTADRLEKKYL